MAMSPRPRRITHFVELLRWCDRYQKYGPLPKTPETRFDVGIYQIYQARAWKVRTDAAYQGWAAAALHFIMASEALDLRIEQLSPYDIRDYEFGKGFDPSYMLNAICRAKQMQIYRSHSGNSTRKSRYDKGIMQRCFASMIEQCFQVVPPQCRGQAVFDEMKIITGDITSVR